MKRIFRMITALLLAVCLVSGMLPEGLTTADAAAVSSAGKTPEAFSDALSLAEAEKDQGHALDEGGWEYVTVKDGQYAVVTGYTGTAGEKMQIPDLLGGADVIGVAGGALYAVSGVREIEIPGNVMTMGAKAIPRGAVVKAANGSYAQYWAGRNGHGYSSISDYKLIRGVVDFKGIRQENFHRVSEREIWLRDLEASRLAEGSLFFLLDPANLYQISYYRALSFEKGMDGFTVVHCETPGVDEVLQEYRGENETLMIDLSTLQLADGVSLIQNPGTSRYSESSVGVEVGLKLEYSGNIGSAKVKLDGKWTSGFKGTYSVGLFTQDKVEIEQTQTTEINLSVSGKEKTNGDQHDIDKAGEILRKVAKMKKTTGKTPSITMPLGKVVVFSVAGILNLTLSTQCVAELEGELKVGFSCSNKSVYTYNQGSDLKKTSEPSGKPKLTGSMEGSFKAGVECSLELYLAVIKVASISIFAGLKVEASYDFGDLMNLAVNAIGDHDGEDTLILEQNFNMNMLDCITLKVHFVAEIAASVGVGDWATIASAKIPFVDIFLFDLHLHLSPFPWKQETVKDNETNQLRYKYSKDFSQLKEPIHRSQDCPYKTYNAKFRLPARQNRVLKKYENLIPGTLVEKPEFTEFEGYYLKFISWHTDKSLDENSKVEEDDWPYPIVKDTTFYAKTVPLKDVHLISANGGGMHFGEIEVTDSLTNTKRTVDFSTGYAQVADNEYFILPTQDTDGNEISLWYQAVSDTNRTAIGDPFQPGTGIAVLERTADPFVLCALTANDIEARFYDTVTGRYQAVHVQRGEIIHPPAGPQNLYVLEFAGWADEDGNLVTEDIVTNQDTPTLLTYKAILVPNTSGGVIPMDNVQIGSRMPQTGTANESWHIFDWTIKDDGTAKITGFYSDPDDSESQTQKNYVKIPSQVPRNREDENSAMVDVTEVKANAFMNNTTLKSIIFPETVTTIGTGVFSGCTGLVLIDLTLVSALDKIPSSFASDCTSLVCLRYPSGKVIGIGNSAFSNCRSIRGIRVDGNIGDYAFYNCSRINSVVLGDNVQSIGEKAFAGCTQLPSLTIPGGVQSIGKECLLGCIGMTSLEINARLNEISGSMFSIGQGSILSSLTLGGGIRKISSGGFSNGGYGFSQLTSLTINGTVQIESEAFDHSGITDLTVNSGSLGNRAFKGLNSLVNVTIGDGVSLIGAEAFMDCTGLRNVTIGKNVNSIGTYAFSGCSALDTIIFDQPTLRGIGSYAFSNCTALEELVIPETVTVYGNYMIQGCTALETLSVGKGIENITGGVPFYISSSNQGLKRIVIREGTTKIPAKAFAHDYSSYGTGFFALEEIVLPSTLREIGQYAFWKAGMRRLTVSSPVRLDSNAFSGCDRLEELQYAAGSIDRYAFEDCTFLKRVIIGDAVTEIGSCAFLNCTNLESVDLGKGLRSIGPSAFSGCSALTELTVPDSVSFVGKNFVSGCTGLKSLSIGSVADTMDTYEYFRIGKEAALQSLVFREGATSIGRSICSNDGISFKQLTSVSFPTTLKSIDGSAFSGVPLQSVTLRSDVEIGEYAFYNCKQLELVSMKGGSIGKSAFEGCNALQSFSMGNVETIGSRAWSNCSALKALTIPDSVTEFNNSAIEYCSGIEYFSIGAAGNGKSIGSWFWHDGVCSLKEIELRDGITTVCSWDFSNMKSLVSVSLPSTLEEIEEGAFSGSGIRKVELDSDTVIGYEAFMDCKQLADVRISSGTIMSRAFQNCTSLRSFVLETGTGEIGSYAFSNCDRLETLDLGEGIREIDNYAFYNCRSLTSLAIPDSVTAYGSMLIWGCTGLKNLYLGGGSPEFSWTGPKYSFTSGEDFAIGPGASLERLTIGEGVTRIPSEAFANPDRYAYNSPLLGYPTLKYVSLPSTLQTIGSRAFAGSGITEITLRGNVRLDSEALSQMTALQRFSMAGGTIGEGALSGDTALTTVSLGNSVTQIGKNAFAGDSALAALYIPDSVTQYGADMIRGCTGLKSLSIGAGLYPNNTNHYGYFSIGEGAQLEMVEIREGIISLQENALANGDGNGKILGFEHLHTVFLPDSLSYLGKGNIPNWPALRYLYLRLGAASLLTSSTEELPAGLTVYTDYYNWPVDDYCSRHGLTYVAREDGEFPVFTLTLAVPKGTALNEGEDLDGQYSILSRSEVEYAENITLPQPELTEGYDLYGWYQDPELISEWIGSAMPPRNLTLYARIEKKKSVCFAVPVPALGEPDDGLPEGWYLYAGYEMKAGDDFPMPAEPAMELYAFYGWYSEASLKLPHRLRSVPDADTVVYGRVEPVSAGGEYQQTDGGLKLTHYKLQEGESTAVSIPAAINGIPVVSIAAGAFENSGVRSVRIPATVTEIEDGAFRNDTGISVILGEGNTSFKVTDGVLYDAEKTTLIYSPKRRGSSMTLTVPDTVTRIADYACYGNSQFTVLYFYEGLTEVGAYAFAGCTGISTVTLPASVTTIRRNAFKGCNKMTKFTAMGLTLVETDVNSETFPPNPNLKFYGPVGSGALRDAVVYKDPKTGKEFNAQYNMYDVSAYVGDQHESMKWEAGMSLMPLLGDITELDNGTAIHGWYRDSACTQPWDLENDTMPEKALSLYASFSPLFSYVTKSVPYTDGTTQYGAVLTGWNGSGTELVIPKYTEKGNTIIGLDAGFLANANGLVKITIPDSIIYIHDEALICADGEFFSGTIIAEAGTFAANWAEEHSTDHNKPEHRITFITAGEAVAEITGREGDEITLPVAERAGRTFAGWSLYQSGSSLVSLSEDGFYLMPASDVTLYAIWEGEEEDIGFTWTGENREVTITGYTGSDATVEIPEIINGWPVTAIGDNAFAGMTEIHTVEIPATVRTIGKAAFDGCEMLRSCALPAGLETIGDNAFRGTALSVVTIPDSVTEVGNGAFADNTSLYQLHIGNGAEDIDAETFAGDTRLSRLIVSDGNNALSAADGVLFSKDGKTLIYYPLNRQGTEYTVPDGTETIGANAFRDHQRLETVTLPISVKYIEDYAFTGCGKLGGVTGEGLVSIGKCAFLGCQRLSSFTAGNSLTDIGSFAFVSTPMLKTIRLPESVQMDPNAVYFDSNGPTLIGKTGSPAQLYARAWGLVFTDPEATNSVTGLTLNPSQLTMERGTTATISPVIQPETAEQAEILWASSNPDVVTVDQGSLRAVGKGTAVIRARSGNGIEAECEVQVVSTIRGLRIDRLPDLRVGEQIQLQVSTVPAQADETVITWNSSEPGVAQVDESGILTAVSTGETVITATAANGISDSLTLKVYRPVTGIQITGPGHEMYALPGENTMQLSLTTEPADATCRDAYWSSGNRKIADVDENGLVTAYSQGTVTITAVSKDPGQASATWQITVACYDISGGTLTAGTEAPYTGERQVIPSITVDGKEFRKGYFDVSWTSMSYAPVSVGEYEFTVYGDGSRTTGRFTGTYRVTAGTPEVTFLREDALNANDVYYKSFYTVKPYAASQVRYREIGSDGQPEETETETPAENGTYLVCITIPETDNTVETLVQKQFVIYTDEILQTVPALTLPTAFSGRIPVTYEGTGDAGRLRYTSSNNAVISISADGTVTTGQPGPATLTISTPDGNTRATCAVTVRALPNRLTMPAALTMVEESAFEGIRTDRILIGPQVTRIDGRAFAAIPGGVIADFANSDIQIADNAFAETNITILCPEGSDAQEYAKKNSIPYVMKK